MGRRIDAGRMSLVGFLRLQFLLWETRIDTGFLFWETRIDTEFPGFLFRLWPKAHYAIRLSSPLAERPDASLGPD